MNRVKRWKDKQWDQAKIKSRKTVLWAALQTGDRPLMPAQAFALNMIRACLLKERSIPDILALILFELNLEAFSADSKLASDNNLSSYRRGTKSHRINNFFFLIIIFNAITLS